MKDKIKLFEYLQKTKGVSRRDFLDMIKTKSLKVNGELVTDFNQFVNIGDKIEVAIDDGVYEEVVKRLFYFKPVIVLFNKPKGYIVSKDSTQGKTIYDLLPKSWLKDFYYIGRLDKDSHGLLLLTNQPKLVKEYEKPNKRIFKIYEVQINTDFKTKDIIKVKRGLLVDDDGNLIDPNKISGKETFDKLAFYDVSYRFVNGKHMIRIVLDEGKKRHIRRLLKALGYKVLDLKRIKFGKYELGKIKPGKYQIL